MGDLLPANLWSDVVLNPTYLWVLVTVAGFWLALALNKACGGSPLVHPVIVSVVLLIVVLSVTGVEYPHYFESVSVIHSLLGPAIVALAVPLFDNLKHLRAVLGLFVVTCTFGAAVAVATAVAVGWVLGFDQQLLLTLSTKSVTTPIALDISSQIGAIGPLAAALVLMTGALGCVFLPLVCRLFNVDDPALKGLVLGVTAHAIGTAFAFRYGALSGALSGLVMGVAGSFTALVLPLVISLLV